LAHRARAGDATAFVGARHFDDARLLEELFELPDWARAPDG
jgi:hypothetical protein